MEHHQKGKEVRKVEFKLATTKGKKAEKKAILGRYYITFNFGNSEEGEKLAQTFKGLTASIGGAEKVVELVVAEARKQKKL
jgi:hypothetical protein